tara:strand:- start:55 stop:1839 length:1785 start_codon:yes stop_codon:yes gene_type:complete
MSQKSIDIGQLKQYNELFTKNLISYSEYVELKSNIIQKWKKNDHKYDAPSVKLAVNLKKVTDKLFLIVKPEQAGKTREVLTRMVTQYKAENTISIVFCDNSLLQVSQTKERGNKFEGLGNICEISSSVSSDAKSAADLLDIFYDNELKFSSIVCCAHSKQLHKNIDEFLTKMAKRKPQYNFEVYIDEASKVATSEKMHNRIRNWELLHNVNKIYFIDATPEDERGGLFSVYTVLSLAPSYTDGPSLSENYIGVKDFDHVVFEPQMGEDNVGYAKRILDAHPLKVGDYAFIPSGHKQKSHNAMTNMLIEKGAVVVVLNGKFKGTYHSVVDVEGTHNHATVFSHKEIQSSSINDIIEKWALNLAKKYKKPLVITGGMVPGRGLSFQKRGLLFTRGIFGPAIANNNMERSQKYGRLKGNIRDFEGYAPVKVHSSKKFHTGCLVQEHTSRWLLDQAQLGEDGYETKMDKETIRQEIKRKTSEYIHEKEIREGPTIKIFMGEAGQLEGRKWYSDNLKIMFGGKGPRIRKMVDGKFECTVRGDKHIYTVQELEKNKGYGLGKKEKYRFYPCYENVLDLTTLQWWLIYYPVAPTLELAGNV